MITKLVSVTILLGMAVICHYAEKKIRHNWAADVLLRRAQGFFVGAAFVVLFLG
jgi:hypothetical protein